MPTRPDLDADRALIEAVIAGDPDAIDRFVRQYARFIYWSACRDTRLGHHDADDVTQRVFVKLLEDDCRRLRLWQGTAFEPFLRQVVHNEALSFARAQFRPDHDPFPENEGGHDGAIDGLPPADDDPEADALLAEVRNFIAHCYDELPPHQQQAVACRYQDELDQRSIAAILGLSQANAAQRVSRATRALRDCLSSKLGDRPWVLA
jgi:RNA polymerase sigma factor (sigma-70 family)